MSLADVGQQILQHAGVAPRRMIPIDRRDRGQWTFPFAASSLGQGMDGFLFLSLVFEENWPHLIKITQARAVRAQTLHVCDSKATYAARPWDAMICHVNDKPIFDFTKAGKDTRFVTRLLFQFIRGFQWMICKYHTVSARLATEWRWWWKVKYFCHRDFGERISLVHFTGVNLPVASQEVRFRFALQRCRFRHHCRTLSLSRKHCKDSQGIQTALHLYVVQE